MVDLLCSTYGCSIVLSIGNVKDITFSQRNTRWKLWKEFRDKCLDYDPEEDNLIENILRTTYPLDDYSEDNVVEHWGCIEDVYSCYGDILIYGENIYSPIEVNFYAYHKPPLKWCDYMRKQGFMVTCYFVDLESQEFFEKCGKCIYDNERVVEEKYTIPCDKIDKVYLGNLYEDVVSFRNFRLNLDRMREYTNKIFFEEGFCRGLCELLDLYNMGPNEIAMYHFKIKNMGGRMELLEKKLENGEINEGTYLESCNVLKEMYDDMGNF